MSSLRKITLPRNGKKRGRQTDYFMDDSFYDSPNEEYKVVTRELDGLAITKRIPVLSHTGNTIFPCYVYDSKGLLLRVVYPKKKRIASAKWK